MTAWSYSSISTFKQCPKKFYHLKVVQDVKDDPGDAATYGVEAHTAAEVFVRDGVEMPAKFKFMEPTVTSFNNIPGAKHCELKLGIKKDGETYSPCDFFAPDAWWRGIADLIILRGTLAYVVDYKTGKSAKYADTKQLDLLAAATFLHFPQVQRTKSALAFVVSNEFVKKDHKREEIRTYLECFSPELERLEAAHENDVWNANPSGLCGWCPVTHCEHWRKRK